MMNSNVTDLQAQLERVSRERDELREALKKAAEDFQNLHILVLAMPEIRPWEHSAITSALKSMGDLARKALGQD